LEKLAHRERGGREGKEEEEKGTVAENCLISKGHPSFTETAETFSSRPTHEKYSRNRLRPKREKEAKIIAAGTGREPRKGKYNIKGVKKAAVSGRVLNAKK